MKTIIVDESNMNEHMAALVAKHGLVPLLRTLDMLNGLASTRTKFADSVPELSALPNDLHVVNTAFSNADPVCTAELSNGTFVVIDIRDQDTFAIFSRDAEGQNWKVMLHFGPLANTPAVLPESTRMKSAYDIADFVTWLAKEQGRLPQGDAGGPPTIVPPPGTQFC